MSISEKIGVLGGTFNPVHMGHLIMAQDAMEHFDLTRVMFIPCSTPSHKKTIRLAEACHRLAMIEAATEDNLSYEVSDIEIKRGGISFAVDTMTHLKKLYIQSEFFFIIGTDTLLDLHSWKNISELLQLCSFVTIARPGFDTGAITRHSLKLESQWADRLLENIVTGHGINISSSDIRHRIAEGMNTRYLIPEAVRMYIAEHNLYSI